MTTIQKPFKKGYKFRICPTPQQKELLEKTFGCCRYVWNKALSETQQEYQAYLFAKEHSTLDSVITPNLSSNGLAVRTAILGQSVSACGEFLSLSTVYRT